MIFAVIHSYLIVKFVLDCFGLFGLIPRNDAQPGVTPRPIGESGFADSGEGLNINRTITHPSLPSYREGTRADAQLTYSPRPLWERAEFVSELCELRNSGEGLKNYHSKPYPLRVLSWICSTLAKPHFRSRTPVRSCRPSANPLPPQVGQMQDLFINNKYLIASQALFDKNTG